MMFTLPVYHTVCWQTLQILWYQTRSLQKTANSYM